MGVVYAARDTRLERDVALKFLPPEWSRDATAKKRLLREAQAASALDHPNICTVHDIGETGDGQLYIVMAHYRGESLEHELERGPLAVDRARDLASQVARGLERAHEAGIVHRDVKPANVFVTARGDARILDFGIAKVAGVTGLTRTGISPGTPAYMSPEQAAGRPVDARTDLWSLGVMLYEMLAGRRPFRGDHDQAVIHAILERDPELLSGLRPEVPADLCRTVAKALAKAPAERYQVAGELAADLEPATAPRPRPRRRAGSRRRSAAAVAGALLLVALGLWTALELWPRDPLRVALLGPEVSSAADPAFGMVAAEVVEAAIATLSSLDGVEPLDPPARDEGPGSEVGKLRAAEADEVLRTILVCDADWCRVRFRRLRDPAGTVLASSEPFVVRAGVENAYELADAVRVHLSRAYSDHRPRSARSVAVLPEDYNAFVEIERRSDAGERLAAEDLDRLDRLLQTSPGLLGAWLLGAGVARSEGDFPRAMSYAREALSLAPHDPRPLFQCLRIEIAARRLEEAAETLERLEELHSGDIRTDVARAELLEAREALGAAHRERLEIVRRRPSWRNVLGLSNLELKLGESRQARSRLEELLEDQPDNPWVLESLASLEAEFGDLRRAASLFAELSQIRPTRVSLSNLGFVHFLLGDYGQATEAYRRALALDSGARLARFNLATALQAQGASDEAATIYRSLLEELAGGAGDVRETMLRVQCLARQGQRQQALALVEEVLERRPEDVQLLHQAAQVYSLLGERVYTLNWVKRSIDKGLRREWFEIPAFAPMQSDPEFRALLEGARSGEAVRPAR
jgi:serine/threonine-protein kinase